MRFHENIMILSITCKIVVTVARPEFFSRVESEIKAVVLTLLQLQLLNAVFRNQKIKTGTGQERREEPTGPGFDQQEQIYSLSVLRRRMRTMTRERSPATGSPTGGCGGPGGG